MRLDGATFLLQWATGGLVCCWVTTRHRVVGLGYGWLLRSVFGTFAAAAAVLFALDDPTSARTVALVASVATSAGAAAALVASVVRRRAGVSGVHATRAHRRARVAAMLGRTRGDAPGDADAPGPAELDARLDLLGPAAGLVGLVAAAVLAGGPVALAGTRLVVGAVFLGVVTDAMLLGHWYLVQPGLPRDPVRELVVLAALVWPLEVAAFLWPTGMLQVFTGAVDDGWDGLLGVIWIVSAASTLALLGVTWLALKERSYSAVMAATGLLYLAILTAFGTDLVARAVLAP